MITPSEVISGRFGNSFDLSGDLLFVGAFTDNSPTTGGGSVFIFERNLGGPDNWGEVMKIEPPENTANFGHSVAVSEDTLIIGAPYGAERGAYLFKQDEGGQNNWGLVKQLESPDLEDDSFFGGTVSISGDVAFVSADSSGFIYIYERDLGGTENWGLVTELSSDDYDVSFSYPIVGHLNQGRLFLSTVDITLPIPVGAVLIFDQDAGGPDNWGLVQTIEPEATNESGNSLFGESIANDGGNLIVGHPGDFVSGTPLRGSGFFYQEGGITATLSPTPSTTPSPTVSTTPTATASPSATPSPTATPTDQVEDFRVYLPVIVRDD